MSDQPKTLTKSLLKKIDSIIIEFPEIEKHEIAEKLNIDADVLKELFIKDRQEELLKQAESASKQLLELNLEDPNIEHKFGKAKIQLIKIKQSESQFIRETLGKDIGYSKRSEITGKDGKEFEVQISFKPPVVNKLLEKNAE